MKGAIHIREHEPTAELLTAAELSRRIGVSASNLNRLANENLIPAHDFGTGKHRHDWRFNPAEVLAATKARQSRAARELF